MIKAHVLLKATLAPGKANLEGVLFCYQTSFYPVKETKSKELVVIISFILIVSFFILISYSLIKKFNKIYEGNQLKKLCIF